MNKKLKRKWVAALRGGSQKQCKYAFDSNGERCVVGVLLSILGVNLREIGLGDALNPYLTIHSRVTLYEMNDSGSTFGEMADWIEVNL
jgi:hypothetical protein